LSIHPRIKSQKGWTTSALIIALCLAAVGILFNFLTMSLGGAAKSGPRKALKWIQALIYIAAWVLVLVMLSSGADRPAIDQTSAFWYAAWSDVFFGVAWFLVLIDIFNADEGVVASTEEHHGEDVTIVPVGGSQKKETSGWRFIWAFFAIFPAAFGIVVFTAIRNYGHSYALTLHHAIVFCAGLMAAELLMFLGILYYWYAFNEANPIAADVYALGALLAAVIGGLLSTDNDLSLTVIVLYALYGSVAVVLYRLAVTPATKALLFLK